MVMPRKAFIADLASACNGSVVNDNIQNVRSGNDDGEFIFSYRVSASKPLVDISVLCLDVSEYPKSHDYQIFAVDEAPRSVTDALETLPSLSGKPIAATLAALSRYLVDHTRTGGHSDPLEIVTDSDHDMLDAEDEDAEDDMDDSDDFEIDGDNEDWAFDGETHLSHATGGAGFTNDIGVTYLARARADLRAVKASGLKVGELGYLRSGGSGYLSISCRVSKLGISDETMAAWSLDAKNYIVLLIHYKSGYRPLEFLQALDSSTVRQYIEMRTGICDSYKPSSYSEAQRAFQMTNAEMPDPVGVSEDIAVTGFRPSFISRPVNELMNDRLVTIIKYRLSMGLAWSGAEMYYNESQGQQRHSSNHLDAKYMVSDDVSSHLPTLLRSDEILSPKANDLSFPLIAMQFFLRHFVQAPQFSLVCHCKLDNQLEAIKPYVCDKGLCLYQYMALGFGGEIEHEIKTQAYVVDLLISFCYSSVKSQALHNFPDGMGLSVPDPSIPLELWTGTSSPVPDRYGRPAATNPASRPTQPQVVNVNGKRTDEAQNVWEAKLDQSSRELLFDQSKFTKCPFTKGDWIAINCPSVPAWHCRVLQTALFPSVTISAPLKVDPNKKIGRQPESTDAPVVSKGWKEVRVHVYNNNFDDLEQLGKYRTMELLLDLLPSVAEMNEYLAKKPGALLEQWLDRISPAALGVLRWIIASNRSCIMQVDQPEFNTSEKSKPRLAEERVQGAPEWLQFRFAMGAPDKEQRFIDSIKAEKNTAPYPTMFAWHGSGLHNWHNIICESLNFNKVTNGRAYGDGVYFARDFVTSSGYASHYRGVEAGLNPNAWPQSMLQITCTLALVEIVNCPEQFQSSNPYYVVKQLDWIQTRYLFVQPCAKLTIAPDAELSSVLVQDPTRIPSASNGKPVVVPLSAVPKSRRPTEKSKTKAKSNLTQAALGLFTKGATGTKAKPIDVDTESVTTEEADLELLMEPEEKPKPLPVAPIKPKKKLPMFAATPFDMTPLENLPTMPLPSYATTAATRRLQKEFKDLLKTQTDHLNADTLSELGWYMDPEFIGLTDNLYQWVVELHSFPLDLPLAIDLKAKKVQSVVLEIRFHHEFPMTPPFVRVVRPRFRPFAEGGGGNVTAGGSICMDLLTNSGWSPAGTIESVLLQIRMAIMSTEPPVKLDREGRWNLDYNVAEAVEAFKRACAAHGWVVPASISEIAF